MPALLTSSLERGGVLTLTLNRPEKRNALSGALRELLSTSFTDAANDPDIAAVVLTGAGGNFCAGGDLSTMGKMTRAQAEERMEAVSAAAMTIAAFPKPVVAAVAGHAAGAGVSLALLCDAVIASQGAKFTFSFLQVGLGPDWGLSHTLPGRVGPASARRLLLSQAQVPAGQALSLGLIDAVVDENALLAASMECAGVMSSVPPAALASVKAGISGLQGLETALATEADRQVERFLSREHLDAMKAITKN